MNAEEKNVTVKVREIKDELMTMLVKIHQEKQPVSGYMKQHLYNAIIELEQVYCLTLIQKMQ